VLLRALAVGALFCAAFTFGYAREIPTPSALGAEPAPPPPGDPRVALWNAAANLEGRLDSGGSGFSFTATQLQVLRPLPGGQPLLAAPDRQHPDVSPTPVDQVILGSLSGRGAATETGFFSQWFTGTAADGSPSFEGDPAYQALTQDGALWRRDASSDDDGAGWIASSDIPGFGVDPLSVRAWPELLRRLDNVQDLGTDSQGHHWSGTTDALWWPGAVAVDGASFTGSPISIEVWLDDSDQLVSLFGVAQNINQTDFAMLCIDSVVFDYSNASIPVSPSDQP